MFMCLNVQCFKDEHRSHSHKNVIRVTLSLKKVLCAEGAGSLKARLSLLIQIIYHLFIFYISYF